MTATDTQNAKKSCSWIPSYFSYAFASLLITLFWSAVLFKSGFIMHGDLAYPTKLALLKSNYYPMWDQHPSFSNLDEIDRVVVIGPLLWLANILHVHVGLFSRLFPYLVSLAGALSIVYCLRVLRRRFFPDMATTAPAILAGEMLGVILFSLNPWALYRVEAPFYQLAYCLCPLFVAMETDFLVDGRLRDLAGVAVVWTFASGSPQYTLFTAIVSICFVGFLGITRQQRLSTMLLRYLTIIGAYALINLHWIGAALDLTHLGTINPGYILHWSDVVGFSSRATLLNVISGDDSWVRWWVFFNPLAVGPFAYVSAILRPFVFVVVIALALRLRKNRFTAFCLGAVFILIPLMQGAQGPLAPIYRWFVLNAVPGYGWLFRAPEKFGAYFWFLISTMLGLGAIALLSSMPRHRYLVATGGLASLLLIAFAPIIYGTLFVHYVPIGIPSTYLKAWNQLRTQTGKVLVLGDYFEQARYNSGDAIFTWAPRNMAGSTIVRSFPLPTFGAYHFSNAFSYANSFIMHAGPSRVTSYAAILGAKFLVLERDIDGDESWYERWKSEVLRKGSARLIDETDDYGLFELSDVPTSELRSGPFAAFVGDADDLNLLVDKYGARLATRNLFLTEQSLYGSSGFLDKAALVILAHRDLRDVVAESYPRAQYARMLTKTDATPDADWSWFRAAFPFEANGGLWAPWERKVLKVPFRWDQDLGTGIVSTTEAGARLRFNIRWHSSLPVDVYVRDLGVRAPRGGAYRIVVGDHGVDVSSRRDARWHWHKVMELSSLTSDQGTIIALNGAPAINAILFVPHNDVERRMAALRARMPGRIVDLQDRELLRKWPEVQESGTITAPLSQTVAGPTPSVLLDETFDPLWRFEPKGNKAGRPSIPLWLFANGFIDIASAGRLVFLPQAFLEKWGKIELIAFGVIIALGVVRGIGRILPRKRREFGRAV